MNLNRLGVCDTSCLSETWSSHAVLVLFEWVGTQRLVEEIRLVTPDMELL